MLTTCGILKRLASALLWKIWKHLDILTLRTEKTGTCRRRIAFLRGSLEGPKRVAGLARKGEGG